MNNIWKNYINFELFQYDLLSVHFLSLFFLFFAFLFIIKKNIAVILRKTASVFGSHNPFRVCHGRTCKDQIIKKIINTFCAL